MCSGVQQLQLAQDVGELGDISSPVFWGFFGLVTLTASSGLFQSSVQTNLPRSSRLSSTSNLILMIWILIIVCDPPGTSSQHGKQAPGNILHKSGTRCR